MLLALMVGRGCKKIKKQLWNEMFIGGLSKASTYFWELEGLVHA